MKSFSQFLHESYLNEEVPAGMTRDQFNSLPAESRRRLGGSKAALGRQGQPLQGGASAPAIRSARASANAAPEVTQTNKIASQTTQPEVKPQGRTTTVAGSDLRGSGSPTPPSSPKPGRRHRSHGRVIPGPRPTAPATTPAPAPEATPAPAATSSSPKPGRRSRVQGRIVPGPDTRNFPSPKPTAPATTPAPAATSSSPKPGRRSRVQGRIVPGPDTRNFPSPKPTAPAPATTPAPVASSSSGGKPPSGARPSTTYRNVGVGKETFATKPSQSQPQTPKPTSNPNIASRRPGESRKDYAARRQAATQQRMSRSSSAIVPAGKSTSSAIVPAPAGKPPVGAKPSRFGRIAGPASAVLDTALSTADERAKGSGWARSLAKGATVAAGGLLGGTAGAIGGGGLLSAATGTAGAMAGGAAAEKAFDTVAGANAKERKAMATANRQRQAGSSLKGIGGTTSFDTKKNTMTTGTGAQRKTVGLAKTGVVQRGGQSVAGHLAYKGGKAVYKAGPSAQSLAKTSSNPLERIGRSLFAGAYKKSDAANAAKKLATARANDAARNKALGVKSKPAG